MKKIFTLLLVFAFSLTIFSQKKETIPTKLTQKGFAAIDYLSVKMPLDEDGNPEINMGLTGVHYNLWVTKSFYAGLGFYGSIHGKRGGLFTLGINAGIKKNLTNNLFIDTGIHFGGGGGASAPDGGGAFILPHLNLGYQFKNFSLTAGYSYINFFDKGNINSHQLNIGVQLPINLDHTSFKNKEKGYSFDDLKTSKWNQNSKRISFTLHLNNLNPFGKSKFTDGVTLKDKTIRLAGFNLNSYINDNWFVFFKADGAYDGIRGGYMDIFLGGGHHYSFNKNRTNILTKFGIGAGGGGGVDTAGGFLIYPDISIEQKLFDNVFLSVNKGYLMSPNHFFASSTLGFGLKYYVNQQGIKTKNKPIKLSIIKGIEIILGQDIYFNAKRIEDPTNHLHQISTQVNVYTSKNWYLAGKTSFANFGGAGAYAEGIVGLGVRSKNFANNKISLFAQSLIGAAGGGNISTGQGLIIKPSVGIYYNLNDKLSLRSEGGYVKAKGGDLSSLYFNFGLSYQIGVLTSK